MTDADAEALTRITARHAAATAGSWRDEDDADCWSLHAGALQILKAPKRATPYGEYWPDEHDADFLAHAHGDIGVLLERIQTTLERLAYLDGMAEALAQIGMPILAGTLQRGIAGVRRDLAGIPGPQPPPLHGPDHVPQALRPAAVRTPSPLARILHRRRGARREKDTRS